MISRTSLGDCISSDLQLAHEMLRRELSEVHRMLRANKKSSRTQGWMDLRVFLAVDDLATLVAGDAQGPKPSMSARDLTVLDRLFPTAGILPNTDLQLRLEEIFGRLWCVPS